MGLIQRFKPSLRSLISAVKGNTQSVLPLTANAPRYEIDLFNGKLSFANPPTNLRKDDYWKGFALDRRPFVNTISGAEFSLDPLTARESCTFYETGWSMPFTRKPTKHRQATLKLLVSLERPNSADRARFPDLTDNLQLQSWLTTYYRDRQAPLSQMAFSQLANGDLAIDFLDESARLGQDTPIPLLLIDKPIAGRAAYSVYLSPGIVECSLARHATEVVQFRFQFKPLIQDAEQLDVLKEQALAYAQQLLESVSVG